MSSILNFYNSLDKGNTIIFWGIIFILLFLIILSYTLIKKNKELRKILKEKKYENNKINSTNNKNTITNNSNLYKENKLSKMYSGTSPISINKKDDKENYLSNVKMEMKKQLKATTSELTEYEQKQEDEAIISFKELEEVKDKLYNITEDEEDGDFIKELKTFREDL